MKKDILSILKGAAIAAVGAFLTVVVPELTSLTYIVTMFGQTVDLTVAVVALMSVLTNIVRKALGL